MLREVATKVDAKVGNECESQGGRRSPNPGCTPGGSQIAKKVEKRSGSLNKKVTDLKTHADI